jgi:hypothetical protein
MWMDYLGNGEMLTNRDGNKFVHNIWEKNVFEYEKCLWFDMLAHESWDQDFIFCSVYIWFCYVKY